MQARTQPLIACSAARSIIAVLLCDEKSRAKSVEQRELWVVDPLTLRVLPYRGGGQRFDHFAVHQGGKGAVTWYETVLLDAVAGDAADELVAASQPAPANGAPQAANDAPQAAPANDAPQSAPTNGAAQSSKESASSTEGNYAFLATLKELIARRRREMPAGSYTAYLFSQGEHKIRKKMGEEVVELLLADNDQEILREAADIIYHMMVFLEVRGLTMGGVLDELARRDR